MGGYPNPISDIRTSDAIFGYPISGFLTIGFGYVSNDGKCDEK